MQHAINRPVLIHSDIGNGKSIFVMQLGYVCYEAGFRVFRIRREPEDLSSIIRFFDDLDEKSIVILDDVTGFKSLCADLIRNGNSKVRVIGTVRSAVLESSRHMVESRFAGQSANEVDLNRLSPIEVSRLVQYLDENGLFGEYADFDDHEKRTFISRNCGGQLRDVILALFETGLLHSRVEEMLERINELSDQDRRITILGALLAVSGFQRFGQLHVVADLADYGGSFEELRSSYEIKELTNLMRLDQSDIVFRSPALAEFVLKRVSGTGQLFDIAKRALFNINRTFYDDPEFIPLSRALLKFSLYGKLFRRDKIYPIADEFYNDCRVLRIANEDPLFLVQRSICNMNAGYYDISKQYVETAYALARKKIGFDNYQIETHNAKLILTMALANGLSAKLEEEIRAQALIDAVIARKNDDLYHPLSVLRLYSDITFKWVSSLKTGEKASLVKLIDRALKHVKDASGGGSRFLGLKGLQNQLARGKGDDAVINPDNLI